VQISRLRKLLNPTPAPRYSDVLGRRLRVLRTHDLTSVPSHGPGRPNQPAAKKLAADAAEPARSGGRHRGRRLRLASACSGAPSSCCAAGCVLLVGVSVIGRHHERARLFAPAGRRCARTAEPTLSRARDAARRLRAARSVSASCLRHAGWLVVRGVGRARSSGRAADEHVAEPQTSGCSGGAASDSTSLRRREICTSRLRSKGSNSRPRPTGRVFPAQRLARWRTSALACNSPVVNESSSPSCAACVNPSQN